MTFALTAMLALLAGASAAEPAIAQASSLPCPMPDGAAGGRSNIHTRAVETNLKPPVRAPGEGPFSLAARMRLYGVPGISIAVIHRGRIDWARGWGVRDTVSCAPVTPDTAFQAASISKVATAVIALRMVEQHKLALDSDINLSFHSWHLPGDAQLAPRGVTLRQLLSHTAGLGVHGFEGYLPGAPLPTTVQILEGAAPANNMAVRSVLPAGAQFQYSGGGYVVTQLALQDVTGLPFAELAQRELLGPLHMTRSAFAQPPSVDILANIAFGHVSGQPVPGNYHVYPELAPAGLWTSAGDLARLLIDLQASAVGQQGHRLSPAMAQAMLRPVKDHWGLGVELYTTAPERFGHDGVNEGFQSYMIAYAGKGEGIVALTNGGQGRRLIDEVVRAVATEYGWTDIAPPAVPEQQLPLAVLAKAAGRFEGGGLSVRLEARPEGLFADAGAPSPERLMALSPMRFFSKALGVVIAFDTDYASFTIVEGGPPMRLVRTTAAPTGSGKNR
ncbi:serine hydrolase domain-containing protein [Sphingomonas azotifigens]|uniref:serine hydrolase domain-containing protein n=1 Tax=Sphingomonas azotifigens TaxID=330920 RepID=UPI0009FC3EB4|nr:serine hydrolase domain-containing protein [Sphingomonas azotifigens]